MKDIFDNPLVVGDWVVFMQPAGAFLKHGKIVDYNENTGYAEIETYMVETRRNWTYPCNCYKVKETNENPDCN